MKFFIPEWDDLVSEDYDFWLDKARSDDRLYAHEIYPKPNYDGILVSRMKLEESSVKLKEIETRGASDYFRFNGPIFGDCGAWGYVKEDAPPFSTSEILSFYERAKVNLGVSIDHLAPNNDIDEASRRITLTLENAKKFYDQFHKGNYSFTPIGACQGYNVDSYLSSFKELVNIGYESIAIGGVARAQTRDLLKILKAINPTVKSKNIDLHLFGVARLDAIRTFKKLGVTSFDSASPLRTAWLGSKKNYRDTQWNGYSAIRLPFLSRTKKFETFIDHGIYSKDELLEIEEAMHMMLLSFDIYENRTPEEVAEAFVEFNREFLPSAPNRYDEYLETLQKKPWKSCPCVICQEVGIEVMIFRGNNRNRRRGFHNTYVFYNLLRKLLTDEDWNIPEQIDGTKQQRIDQFFM